jgi:hypothetical protein
MTLVHAAAAGIARDLAGEGVRGYTGDDGEGGGCAGPVEDEVGFGVGWDCGHYCLVVAMGCGRWEVGVEWG